MTVKTLRMAALAALMGATLTACDDTTGPGVFDPEMTAAAMSDMVAATDDMNEAWVGLSLAGSLFEGTAVAPYLPGGAPIAFRLAGQDFDQLSQAAGELANRLRAFEGLYDRYHLLAVDVEFVAASQALLVIFQLADDIPVVLAAQRRRIQLLFSLSVGPVAGCTHGVKLLAAFRVTRHRLRRLGWLERRKIPGHGLGLAGAFECERHRPHPGAEGIFISPTPDAFPEVLELPRQVLFGQTADARRAQRRLAFPGGTMANSAGNHGVYGFRRNRFLLGSVDILRKGIRTCHLASREDQGCQ